MKITPKVTSCYVNGKQVSAERATRKYADGGVVSSIKGALGMKSDAQKAADAQTKRDDAKAAKEAAPRNPLARGAAVDRAVEDAEK